MKFTYNIQKIDFFPDQVEEKGKIDLEGAIKAFQNFPFNDQLKEASFREESTCSPTITYKSENGSLLAIWADDNRGFYLHYENEEQISDWYLASDYNLNPKGYTVEEFIEHFFNNTIEQPIKLRNKLATKSKTHETKTTNKAEILIFSFQDANKISHYYWTIPYVLIALYFFFSQIESRFDIGLSIHIILSFLWLPGTILHLTYWSKNLDTIVTINKTAKTIEYRQSDKIIYFHRDEIEFCELNETRSHRAPWQSYKYLWIKLKDKQQIVITNFVVEPEIVVQSLKLKYKTDKRTIPFLPI